MQAFTLDPRLAADTRPVAELELSSLRLMNDARWPWLILVPRVAAASELIDLPTGQRALLLEEVSQASRALQSLFAPDKLNVAALGNVVAQLHVHVIARHRGDPAWPSPVWGHGQALPYAAEALAERLATLREALDRA